MGLLCSIGRDFTFRAAHDLRMRTECVHIYTRNHTFRALFSLEKKRCNASKMEIEINKNVESGKEEEEIDQRVKQKEKCEQDKKNKNNINNVNNNNDKKKKKKRGIVYLSSIPKYMNVAKLREILSAYGNVGRIYLQLAENEIERVGHPKKRRKTCAKSFTEGWVEFESKKVAKYVAATLNNTQVSMRKKSKFYDVIWNVKYLPRFKWVHLGERLAYERAVRKQRLRTEIVQAKKEATFFSSNIDRSKKLRSKEDRVEGRKFELSTVKQRETDAEILLKKEEKPAADRGEFLKSLFG